MICEVVRTRGIHLRDEEYIVSKAKDCILSTFKVKDMARKKTDDHNLSAVLERDRSQPSQKCYYRVVPTGLWRTITVKLWSAFMMLGHCSFLAPLPLRRPTLHQGVWSPPSYLVSEEIALSSTVSFS